MRTIIYVVAGLLICLCGCAPMREFILDTVATPEGGEAVKAASDIAQTAGAFLPPPIGTIVQVVGGLIPAVAGAAGKVAKAFV